MISSVREEPLEKRLETMKLIEEEFPNHIAIICERSSLSSLPNIKDTRFLLEPTANITSLAVAVGERLELPKNAAELEAFESVIHILDGPRIVPGCTRALELAEQRRDPQDNIVYLTYVEHTSLLPERLATSLLEKEVSATDVTVAKLKEEALAHRDKVIEAEREIETLTAILREREREIVVLNAEIEKTEKSVRDRADEFKSALVIDEEREKVQSQLDKEKKKFNEKGNENSRYIHENKEAKKEIQILCIFII